MDKITVTGDDKNNVVIKSKNNPEYGHIRVTQLRPVFDEKGFLRPKNLSALIPGLIGDLKMLKWTVNQEVSGRIIIKEQLAPFNPKDPDKDLKIAGKTGITCVADGQPIYRKTFFTTSQDAPDVLVAHTNGEEIKAAYEKLEKEGANLQKS